MRRFRYLDALTTTFVVILLVSNLVAQKVVRIGPVSTSGAMLLFPITYIFGDIFTEIYGYAASRRAIWLGFFGTALLYAISALVIALPSDPEFHNQQAFVTVFGILPRILIASLAAFWAGEFANSYTMAKLKLITKGRWLWTRTVGSTVVGQAVDTTLVIVITFAGTFSPHKLVQIIVTGYLLKVAYEVLATPLTYLVVNWLKRAEDIDTFDTHTNFNPFRFAGQSKSGDG
jgi:uncharacterized integral membrane protein (TIGR00697 family)